MSDSQTTMAAAPESQSSAISPRYHLPDDWSGKGACPVCRTAGQLRVEHQDVAPDRMVCGVCGVAFEVATAGARIRVAAVPPALAANTAELADVWLTPAELMVLVERAAPLSSEPANGHGAEPDAESGSEDWFATLAAAIGGLSPAKPPPDSVLADELERALMSRPEPSPNIGAEPAPDAMAAAASDVAASVLLEPAAAMSTPPAAPGTVNAGNGKLADPSSELIGPGAPAIPPATAAPEVAASDVAGLKKAEPNLAPPTVMGPSTSSVAAPGTQPRAGALALVPASDAAAIAVAPAAVPAISTRARAGTASRHELSERAWKLHELGNSLPSIQAALESSRGTPDDVKIIMAKLVTLEQARQARFRRNVQWAAVVSILVLVILLAIAAVVSRLTAQQAPAATSGPRVTAASYVSPDVGTPGAGRTNHNGNLVAGQTGPTAARADSRLIAFLNDAFPATCLPATSSSAKTPKCAR